MLYYAQIKTWFLASAKKGLKFFRPESSHTVQRLQLFWVGCAALVIIVLAYGISTFLFGNSPLPQQEEAAKSTTTSIETATKKINLDEAFRNGIEGKLKTLSDDLLALKTLFQEGAKRGDFPSEGLNNEGDNQPFSSPSSQSTLVQDLEAKILNLEQQLEMQRIGQSSPQPFLPQGSQEEQQKNLIQKVSLSLTENPKNRLPKTVETTIPAGAFAKTVLLSGLDASSAMTASSDPRPMLLRLIDFGTLPRRFQSDLKDCHCTASAYGDLSSERVYARLEKLTCVERKTGEIIETQVAGYISGPDGKAGIRGIVASKDGQFLGRSLVGGVFAGLSNVANPQNRQAQGNPFMLGGNPPSPPNVGDLFTSGMASGASSALDRLSQYYIDRAEQLQPVIQVAAGQVVDIVFTEGTFIGSQDVKEKIEVQRDPSIQSTEPNNQH
ncbi:MAG: TraB/VirB10 family protein [Alphaproteobacteria bacterium]|jgi:conjugal transfer pilus assembly protein TraB|nr:TraB/VirB10 family protein [Alphaproteobacteria bacterium]MBP9776822.1 TraB/VirB10 family protein [Alphaproteobacteria bacterium]